MEPGPCHTLVEVFAAYQAESLLDAASHTRYQYLLFARRLVREVGNLPLVAVTPDVVRAWKARLSLRCGPGTIQRYMKMLSAVLRFAVEDLEWLGEHPMARVRKPSAPPGRVRCLSQEERTALLAACHVSPHPYLYAIVVLALSTGGRKNELRTLAWSAVDCEIEVVRFLKTKTRLARTVPLVGEALTLLREMAARRRVHIPWVFPATHGRTPIWIEVAWRAARLASGVTDLRFHDLRHTYASYLAMSGASLSDIATLLGHVKLQQSLRYIHLMPGHTRGIVTRMAGQFLGRDEGG
jgi:integrase